MRIGDVGACRHREDVGVRCLGGETGPPVINAIEIAASTDADGRYAQGTSVRVTLVWSQPVTVTVPEGATGPKVIVAYNGTIRRYASYLTGSGTDRTTFIHTVDFDGADTIAVPANSLSGSAGASITVGGGRASRGARARGVPRARAPRPSITNVAIVGEPGAERRVVGGRDRARATSRSTGSVAVTTSANGPTIGLTIGSGAAKRAAYESGSGSVTLVFAYTLVSGDAASPSLTVPENSLALDGGQIQGRIVGLDAVLDHEAATRTDSATSNATASFSGVPASHDGSTAFQIRLRVQPRAGRLELRHGARLPPRVERSEHHAGEAGGAPRATGDGSSTSSRPEATSRLRCR